MPYVTFNISDKIEMNGFETEAEARAYCRKGSYPYFVLFEGTIDDADENRLTMPIAVYVKGKGFNCTVVEKDVPYTTYRVISERLPNVEGFTAILAQDKTYGEVRDEIDAAFERGAKTIWEILEDMRMITVWTAADRQHARWYRDDEVIQGGEFAPGYFMKVVDLFAEVVVE
jgi:hypothetical protein